MGLLAVQQYGQPERAWFPAGPAGTLLGSAQEGMLAPGVMLCTALHPHDSTPALVSLVSSS